MVSNILYQGAIGGSTKGVVVILFSSMFPGELHFKLQLMQGTKEFQDIEVWFADKEATADADVSTLSARAKILAQNIQIFKKNRPGIYFNGNIPNLQPPLSIIRGTKVEVETENHTYQLGKVSRIKGGLIHVHFVSGKRARNISRSKVKILGRYRPGQYNKKSDLQEHPKKIVGPAEASVVKIQALFRGHLGRAAYRWFRGQRAARMQAEVEETKQKGHDCKPVPPVVRPISCVAPPLMIHEVRKHDEEKSEECQTEQGSKGEQKIISESSVESSEEYDSPSSDSSDCSCSSCNGGVHHPEHEHGDSKDSHDEEEGEMAIEHFHVYDDPESDGELPKPFNRIPFVYPEDPVTVADIVGTRGKIQLFTMTFNANSLLPDLDAFRASLQTRNRHILYALAFQDLPQHDIEKIINGILGDDYLKMKHAQLGSLQLFVMAHHTIAPLIQNIEADTVALGASLDQDSKSHRAKGAVAICFTIAKKSIIFVNAHFRGKQEAIAARNANFHEINARLKLPTGKLQTLEPISGRFDFAFWLGDLNYRIGLSYDQTWGYLDSANFKSLWEHDQLLKNTNAFDGYIECPLNFPPTFKYLPLTDKYNEKCVPSWTDRILYKSNEECEPVAYDSFDPLKTSTHRAVWGVFSLTLAKPHALWAEWHIRQQAFIQNSEQHHEKLKQQDNKVTQQKKNEQAPLTKQAKTSRTVVFPHDTENSAPARKHASDYCVVM